MSRKTQTGGAIHGWRRWTALGLGAAFAAASGCDTAALVQLDDPDLITRPVIEDPANLGEVRNGVLFEFARAYAGPAGNNQNPGIIGHAGLMTDELWYASTFTTFQDIDRRRVLDFTNSSLLTVFRYIQRARNLGEQASAAYAASDRANSADHALVTNLAGYSYIFLAENYCSGVPISRAEFSGNLEYGAPQTTQQLFQAAIANFDAALAMMTGAENPVVHQRNLARVGKARALLGLNQIADAAAIAAQVPADYEYLVRYSPGPSANNGLWYNINSERRSSAATNEGVNGLPFFRRDTINNTIDPRVPVDSSGFGIGASIPHYAQFKYPGRDAPIVLASGREARLIQAEALLNGGASDAYLPILNALRDEADIGLAPLSDPGTPQARVRQLFSERAFWMWLTAHRLGDMRRMVRQYNMPANTVFPVGTTIFGQAYGDDVNLPIPFNETNNPEFGGQCLNRDA
jgi:starch-binding outer membrane protein, SusD/RagB family